MVRQHVLVLVQRGGFRRVHDHRSVLDPALWCRWDPITIQRNITMPHPLSTWQNVNQKVIVLNIFSYLPKLFHAKYRKYYSTSYFVVLILLCRYLNTKRERTEILSGTVHIQIPTLIYLLNSMTYEIRMKWYKDQSVRLDRWLIRKGLQKRVSTNDR